MHNHIHWTFLAFDGDPTAKEVQWATELTVIGYTSEESAREAAKKITTRDNYKLTRAFECNTCLFQTMVADNLKDK